MKFFASLKGIDLDKNMQKDAVDRVQEIKDKIAAEKRGKTTEGYKVENYFGMGYEVEE